MEKVTLFLGGTCASSTWREELMPMLEDHVEAFNPVVPNWTPECQAAEDAHRENDDICLYRDQDSGLPLLCLTFNANTTSKSNILCQKETGKKIGSCSNDWCQYSYK